MDRKLCLSSILICREEPDLTWFTMIMITTRKVLTNNAKGMSKILRSTNDYKVKTKQEASV